MDFKVNASDIVFETNTPREGQNVSINVTVYNTGLTQVDDLIVLIRDETTNTLLENYTLNAFTTNETIITWINATRGPHNISVTIDPSDTFTETNETNNYAYTWLNVSVWHTIFGNVTKTISLDGVSSSFYTWPTENATGGYIYAVDADASISWNSLQALGRTISGTISSNDFTQIDTVLSYTGYADSIISLFGQDASTPKETDNFTLYEQSVDYVPIMNSTEDGSFKTGILWDASDDGGDSEYSGTESLIFMTEIVPDTSGQYGTYDYELTIPSALQETEGSSDMTYLYVELT